MAVPTTKTGVKALLASRGLLPRRLRGQNFLVDANLVEWIVRAAGVTAGDCVLEIGTGTGILTQALAARAGCVVTCDVDRRLQEVAKSVQPWPESVVFLPQDVLASKRRLEPSVVGRWEEERARRGLKDLLCVSNLPYAVATPVLAGLLWEGHPARAIVVMVQREAADRFLARPGTKEYGPISVAVSLLGEAALLKRVGRKVFWPEPRVDSAVLRVVPKDPGRAVLLAREGLPELLHRLFLHRRKSLRGRVEGAALHAAGIDPALRPEEVAPEAWARLQRALAGAAPPSA